MVGPSARAWLGVTSTFDAGLPSEIMEAKVLDVWKFDQTTGALWARRNQSFNRICPNHRSPCGPSAHLRHWCSWRHSAERRIATRLVLLPSQQNIYQKHYSQRPTNNSSCPKWKQAKTHVKLLHNIHQFHLPQPLITFPHSRVSKPCQVTRNVSSARYTLQGGPSTPAPGEDVGKTSENSCGK